VNRIREYCGWREKPKEAIRGGRPFCRKKRRKKKGPKVDLILEQNFLEKLSLSTQFQGLLLFPIAAREDELSRIAHDFFLSLGASRPVDDLFLAHQHFPTRVQLRGGKG
jgi:hypothetical protein